MLQDKFLPGSGAVPLAALLLRFLSGTEGSSRPAVSLHPNPLVQQDTHCLVWVRGYGSLLYLSQGPQRLSCLELGFQVEFRVHCHSSVRVE